MTRPTLTAARVERILRLRSIRLLRDVPPVHLAAVAEHAVPASVPAGDRLVEAGIAPDAVHLILAGRVRVSRPGRPPVEAGPGDIVGFTHLLARVATGLEARALEDTTTLRLGWETLLDLWEDHFPVLLAAIRFLGRRSLEALGQLPPGARFDRGRDPPVPAGSALNLVDRLLTLRESANFPDDTLDALAEMARHVSEVRFAAGDRIWRSGDPAGDFLLLHAGAVRAERPGSPGGHFALGPGRTVGMQETLCDRSRWYDAVVERPVTALRVAREPFLDILEDHFDLAIGFTVGLAQRLLEVEALRTRA